MLVMQHEERFQLWPGLHPYYSVTVNPNLFDQLPEQAVPLQLRRCSPGQADISQKRRQPFDRLAVGLCGAQGTQLSISLCL